MCNHLTVLFDCIASCDLLSNGVLLPVNSTRNGQKVRIESFHIKFAKSVQIGAFADTVQAMKGRGIDSDSATESALYDQFLQPHFLDQFLPMKLGQTFSCDRIAERSEDEGEVRTDMKGNFKITSIETFDDEDEAEDDDVHGAKKTKVKAKANEHSAELGDYCIIGPDTEIVLDSDPLPLPEEEGGLFDLSYDDIGGCGSQLGKIREVLELPLRHPELFRTLGITPPRGVLMHGPPGEVV